MQTKYIELLPLFKKYIADTKSGKRFIRNNKKVSASTLKLQGYIYNHLVNFSVTKNFELKILPANKLSKKTFEAQKKYWKNFFRLFCNYLYDEKKCSDNYVGMIINNLKSFFGYLEREHNLHINGYYKNFKVERPHPAIVVLTPERLHTLIYDTEFNNLLTPAEQRIKDIFIIGCVTALRFSDLMALRKSNILVANNEYYVTNISLKTSTATKVKLPGFASKIITGHKSRSQLLFNPISLFNFNKHLKSIGDKAGWTEPIFKTRKKRGQENVLYKNNGKKEHYRFCDLMSSHLMRRTAITTMLTLGVEESVARKISGHAPGSSEFYRYVKYSQDYLNTQTDDYFTKLTQVKQPENELEYA